MKETFTPGNIGDFKAGSKEPVKIVCVGKDFSGQSIENVKLIDSIISNSNFTGAKITDSEFTQCDFSKDIFVDSFITGVNFVGCDFFEVDFTNCTMKYLNADSSCNFINCIFNNANLSTKVDGVSADMGKIIPPADDENKQDDETIISDDTNKKISSIDDIVNAYKFEKKDDGTLEKEVNISKITIGKDPDKNEGILDITFWKDNTPLITTNAELAKDDFNAIFAAGLKDALEK